MHCPTVRTSDGSFNLNLMGDEMTAFFVKNDWDDRTLDPVNDSWVNDGRCSFESEDQAQAAIRHYENQHPEDAGRLIIISYKLTDV